MNAISGKDNRGDLVTRCPLCHAGSMKKYSLKHTVVFACSSKQCGLRFASPQLDDEHLCQAYEMNYYPASRQSRTLQYENTAREILEQVFARLAQKTGPLAGKAILDYGCGRGDLCAVASELKLIPTGIEFDDNARLEAAHNGRFSVYKDIDSLVQKEPLKKFDLVVLWQVIEHLRVPWGELRRLHCVLKPGGVLIVSTPNADGLKARSLRSRWDNYTNPTHFYYFTPRSLHLTLNVAGFSANTRWRSFISYPGQCFGRRTISQLSARLGINGELFYVAQSTD